MATIYNNTITVKSKGGSGHSSIDAYNFRLEVINNGETTTANKSNVTVNVYGKGIKGYSYYGSSNSYLSVSLESSKLDNSLSIIYTTVAKIHPSGTEIKIGTWTGDVEHEDNGALTISIAAFYESDETGYYYPKDAALSSGNLTLPNIARKTTAIGFTGFIEKSTSIAFSPASSSFTHSVKLSFGNNTKWLNASGGLSTSEVKLAGSSFGFNVPSEYYNEFIGESANGTLLLTTYSGDTVVGSSSAYFTIYADKGICEPVVTGSLVDVNETTIVLTGNANNIVKGYSTGKLTITKRISSANDSKATITSLIVAGNFVNTSVTELNITSLLNKFVNVTLINSRGASKTFIISASGNLVEYVPLTLSANFKRVSATSNIINLTFNGNYFNDSFGSIENTLALNLSYRESGTTSWTDLGAVEVTKSGNTYSGAKECGTNFDYQKNYEFKLSYSDKLVSAEPVFLVTKGIELFGIYQDGSIRIDGQFIELETVADF